MTKDDGVRAVTRGLIVFGGAVAAFAVLRAIGWADDVAWGSGIIAAAVLGVFAMIAGALGNMGRDGGPGGGRTGTRHE